jgi:hypothetical protein
MFRGPRVTKGEYDWWPGFRTEKVCRRGEWSRGKQRRGCPSRLRQAYPLPGNGNVRISMDVRKTNVRMPEQWRRDHERLWPDILNELNTTAPGYVPGQGGKRDNQP